MNYRPLCQGAKSCIMMVIMQRKGESTMSMTLSYSIDQLHYLKLLSHQYPTVQAASSEIVRLRTILNLPKCTEHFMSDIHGEHEAFLHILNSGSGEIKEKLESLFAGVLTRQQIKDLATLIYYPAAKLALVSDGADDLDSWYSETLHRLVEFCHFVSAKHTQAMSASAEVCLIFCEVLGVHCEISAAAHVCKSVSSALGSELAV